MVLDYFKWCEALVARRPAYLKIHATRYGGCLNGIFMSLNTSFNSTSQLSIQSAADLGISTNFTKHLVPQLLGALLFGATVLYGVGFASADVAHNAAHDTRHAFAFPCH